MRKTILLPVLLILFFATHAQKEVKVRGCTGIWTVSDDITPREAEEKALMEARKEAMRQAGVFEEVWSAFGQVSENENNQFYEVYSQVNALAIGGMMNVSDKKVKNIWDPSTETLSKEVTINATVKVDNEADREFMLKVEGVDVSYKNRSGLTFTVTPTNRDAYITIFWFDEEGGSVIYPNESESSRLFQANMAQAFPGNGLKYELSKTSNRSNAERINLLFVATRQNIPYIEKNVTFENVLKWVYSIPARDRATAMQMLQITN